MSSLTSRAIPSCQRYASDVETQKVRCSCRPPEASLPGVLTGKQRTRRMCLWSPLTFQASPASERLGLRDSIKISSPSKLLNWKGRLGKWRPVGMKQSRTEGFAPSSGTPHSEERRDLDSHHMGALIGTELHQHLPNRQPSRKRSDFSTQIGKV